MARRPKDSLEKFFVKRVKDYHFDFKLKDWQNLEQMLDASRGINAAAFRQKMAWIGSISLVVISVALFIWMSGVLNDVENTVENLENSNVENNSELIESDPQISESPFNQEKESLEQTELLEQDQQSSRNLSDTNFDSEDRSILGDQQETDLVSDSNPGLIAPTDESATSSIMEQNGISETTFKEEALLAQIEDSRNRSKGLTVQKLGINFGKPDLSGIHIDFEKIQMHPSPILIKNYSWNFSASADFSAVGASDFDGPSLRAGLSFEYYFSPIFSLMAGVNYAVKNYQAFGREYTPPYGFWTKGVVPEVTDASCNVLDIPVNLTVYLPNTNGSAFFIRAGLSSWLMLEEHYYYEYVSNDPDLIDSWGGKNENYHYFSIVNLAIGFEQPLSKKTSVLAEPYFNIPLGGVGFGDVDLYSAGIKITFKVNSYKLKTTIEE